MASIKGSTAATSVSTTADEEYDPTTTISGAGSYQSKVQYSSSYKASATTAASETSATADKSFDVDEEMNEDDFFEFPDEEGVKVGEAEGKN